MPDNDARESLLNHIIQTFRQFGYEGSSLSVISAQTGLKRASLYHHFPGGKAEMAQAAFDQVLQSFDQLVLSPLREEEATPQEKLVNCASGLNQFYAEGANACLIDIFSIGESRQRFQAQLASRTQAVIDQFAVVAEASGLSSQTAHERAEDMMMQLQGALVLSRSLNKLGPFQRFLKELPARLLAT